MAYKVIIKTLGEEEITQAVEWYFNKGTMFLSWFLFKF